MEVETHCPNRRGEAQHSSLQSVWDKGNDVFPQTSVSVQSPEDVQRVDLWWGKHNAQWQNNDLFLENFHKITQKIHIYVTVKALHLSTGLQSRCAEQLTTIRPYLMSWEYL